MKSASLAVLLFFTVSAFAVESAETAYTALRVVGKLKGATVLNQVVELRGRNGAPQPAVWKIVMRESGARGGLREIEVQRGRIISERTPTFTGAAGEPMDLTHLNLDSDGLFTVINQEARQSARNFDRVDYVLRSGSGGGSPVWTADLYDGRNGKVETMQVAADSGTVLARSRAGDSRGNFDDDHNLVRNNPPPAPRRSFDSNYSQPGESFRGVPDFFHRLGNRIVRHGEKLENFFTGRSGRDADVR